MARRICDAAYWMRVRSLARAAAARVSRFLCALQVFLETHALRVRPLVLGDFFPQSLVDDRYHLVAFAGRDDDGNHEATVSHLSQQIQSARVGHPQVGEDEGRTPPPCRASSALAEDRAMVGLMLTQRRVAQCGAE